MMKFAEQQSAAQQQELYGVTYVPDALDESAIREIEKFAMKAVFNVAGVGGSGDNRVDGTTRRSQVAWLDSQIIPKEISAFFERLILSINERHYQFQLNGMEPLQFTVYEESVAGEYKWHIDTMRLPDNLVRKLSVSILLSDPKDFEGGKLLVSPNGQTLVAEERQGRAIFFPSWVPHCVTPVTRGIRKSLVIWAHGPMFK